MSSTERPKRAAFARSMRIETVGWPSERNTARSATPGTVARIRRISSALRARISSSGPKTLMAFAPFTPEAASWTLSLIAWA